MERYPLTRQERGRLWIRLGIRAALGGGAVLLAVRLGPPLFSLFAPFVLALPIAWLLNGPVRWFQRRLPLSRKLLSLVLLLAILGALGGAVYVAARLLLGQVRALLENWETMMEELSAGAERLTRLLPEGMGNAGRELVAQLAGWPGRAGVADRMARLAERAPAMVSGLSGFAVAAAVFVMASYFVTEDYPRMRFRLADRLPGTARRFCSTVRTLCVEAFGGWLKSQLLLSLGVFGILGVGFFVVGQPYGLLLAAGLAALDFVPIVGAGTVMAPWAIVELLSGHWRRGAELAVIWGITVLFRRIAEPKILGDQTGLSPVLSLVGIYAGMKLAGVLGMILGPVVLLVAINLARLGVLRGTADDLRRAGRDVMSLLKEG